jgi:hypothetical protein
MNHFITPDPNVIAASIGSQKAPQDVTMKISELKPFPPDYDGSLPAFAAHLDSHITFEGSSSTPLPTGVELQVCQDITERQAHGLAKYGVSVADNPLSLREWLQHAYEEGLDKVIYLRRAMNEIDKQSPPPNDTAR